MAQIKWQKRASRVLEERLAYAYAEFGELTAIVDIWDTRVRPKTLKRRIR